MVMVSLASIICDPLAPSNYRVIGASLAEMADLMVAAGAWSAIELDGGGSSTTVIV